MNRSPNSKVRSLSRSELEKAHSNEGDFIRNSVVCYGSFNVLHPGHFRYLSWAKSQGNKLTVIVTSIDRSTNPEDVISFPIMERAESLASIEDVDQVIISSGYNLENYINIIRPELLVLGKEYETELREIVQESIVLIKSYGGKVRYHSGETNYSHSVLGLKNDGVEQKLRLSKFCDSCSRQNIQKNHLIKRLESFKNSSILVIGDTIVDQYVACDAIGMSAEAPVIVVKELDTETYIGGGAIVSAHIKALGAKCKFISVVGDDKEAEYVRNSMRDLEVTAKLIIDKTRPTTFKNRYMVESQKMFRVSRLKDHTLDSTTESKVIAELECSADGIDAILISDFVYGVITPKILATIKKIAMANNLLVFGDLQCSSQVGSVLKFQGLDLITPTEREARIGLSNKDDSLETISNLLIEQTDSRNLIMKLGSDGFIAYEKTTSGFINRQHFPAMTINPLDVTGAGDSLISAMAVSLSSGSTLMEAAAIGAQIAAISVRSVGNLPIDVIKLKQQLKELEF